MSATALTLRTRVTRGWPIYVPVVLTLAALGFALNALGASSAAVSGQRTATASRGVVQTTVSGSGTLEAARQVNVDFATAGTVTHIYVKEGQHVQKGTLLASLDSSAARITLSQARAQLRAARSTLSAAQAGSTSASATTASNRGASAAGISYVLAAYTTTNPSDGPSGPTNTSQTGSGAGSQTTTQSQPSTTGSSQGGSGSGQSQGVSSPNTTTTTTPSATIPSSGQSTAGSSSGSSSSTASSAASAQATVEQARLSVKSAEDALRQARLRAPISGTVASVSGSIGEAVGSSGSTGSSGASNSGSSNGSSVSGAATASTASNSASTNSSSSSSSFLVLSQLGRMKADVSVSESDITKVKVGQPATVTVNALTNTKLAARVTHIAVLPTSSSSGTSSVVSYAATLTLTQRGPGLRPGMSATADVVTQQANDAITVPNAAITRAGPLQTVTVREPDGTTATKTVTTGLVGNSSTQVLTGLKAGGTVILPAVSAPAAAGTGSSASGAPGGFGGGFGGGGFPGGRPTGPPTGAFPGGGG